MKTKRRPIKFSQHDLRWREHDYSAKGEKCTVSQEGCGPTSAAMLLATFIDPQITPAWCCDWSRERGYKAVRQGTYYTYFVAQFSFFGVECEQVNFKNLQNISHDSEYFKQNNDRVLKALQDGYYVIACMGPGHWTRSGHFVVLYDVKDGTAYINDPNSFRADREQASWWTFRNEVKYYFIVKIGDKKQDKDKKEGEKKMQKRYNKIEEIPEFAKEAVKKLIDGGIFADAEKLDLSYDMVRLIYIFDKYYKNV